MRNPPIARAIVADKFGDVLYDSAEPNHRRPGPVRPPIVRRYAPPATPIRPADPASAAVSALVAGLAIALAAGGCLVALALTWRAMA